MLPKARDGADVHRVDHWLEVLEARLGQPRGGIGLLPLITESAGALLKAASFTALPSRVVGLTWGAEDLATDVGALGNKAPDGEFEMTYAMARSFCLLAAASAGVPAIDTVDTEIRDTVAVERRARNSRRQGFVGKLAIHPAQVAPIHAAFSPTEDEVRWAERVLAAFAAVPARAQSRSKAGCSTSRTSGRPNGSSPRPGGAERGGPSNERDPVPHRTHESGVRGQRAGQPGVSPANCATSSGASRRAARPLRVRSTKAAARSWCATGSTCSWTRSPFLESPLAGHGLYDDRVPAAARHRHRRVTAPYA